MTRFDVPVQRVEVSLGDCLLSIRKWEVQRFLVVCTLASDLYCPGYNLRQSLAKGSNLARAAARYKIDTAKLSATVREELSKPRKQRTVKKTAPVKSQSK